MLSVGEFARQKCEKHFEIAALESFFFWGVKEGGFITRYSNTAVINNRLSTLFGKGMESSRHVRSVICVFRFAVIETRENLGELENSIFRESKILNI